jgi:cell division protein FtsB
MGFFRKPGCKNSIVWRMRHIPNETLATDIANLNNGVGDQRAIHANMSMSEDTSTYKKEYDVLSQREQPLVSSAGDV